MRARSAQFVVAAIWLIFFILQVSLLACRTVWSSNSADLTDATNDMWKWYLPMILPTISIVLGAIFASSRAGQATELGLFGVVVAALLSVLYLASVSSLLLIPPTLDVSPKDHVKLLHDSAYWLGGIQVGVGLAIGFVFGKSTPETQTKQAPTDKNADGHTDIPKEVGT